MFPALSNSSVYCGAHSGHPTQKPVTALAPLIRSLTRPGEIILDPFAASGSSCGGTLLMGRNYIGVELDQEHFNQAVARMERVAGRIAARLSPR
jgi:site-specific DNA-methyltransferase (adenine-specific)